MKFKPMHAFVGNQKILDKKGYIFEPKLDGIRALCYVNEELKFLSRNDLDITSKYPEFNFKKNIHAKNCILDGEIVVYDELDRPSFTLLQQRHEATYVVFDILMKDNESLLKVPLIERKALLETTVKKANNLEKIIYTKSGKALWQAIQKIGLEGVVAKEEESSYLSGKRSRTWLKIKLFNSLDCIIVGYTSKRRALSSLALALYDHEKSLRYIGKVGTGFDEKEAENILIRLEKIKIKKPPVINPQIKDVVWVKPRYACEITYSQFTHQGIIRHPVFIRERWDKNPEECTIPSQVPLDAQNRLRTS